LERRAAAELRALRDGPRDDCRPERTTVRPAKIEWSDDECFVLACLQVSKQTRHDPWVIAREGRGWSRERWETLQMKVDQKRRDRWACDAA